MLKQLDHLEPLRETFDVLLGLHAQRGDGRGAGVGRPGGRGRGRGGRQVRGVTGGGVAEETCGTDKYMQIHFNCFDLQKIY